MIKRFHALYVGQIELDNIGLDGTPANDRRYSNDRLRVTQSGHLNIYLSLIGASLVVILLIALARHDRTIHDAGVSGHSDRRDLSCWAHYEMIVRIRVDSAGSAI